MLDGNRGVAICEANTGASIVVIDNRHTPDADTFGAIELPSGFNVLRLDRDIARGNPETTRLVLAEMVPSLDRLIFAGVGAGAVDAIVSGITHCADAVLAVSPELEQGSLPGPKLGIPENRRPKIFVLAGEDWNANPERIVGGEFDVSALSWKFQKTNIPSVALSLALRHTALIQTLLAAVARGQDLPEIPDIRHSWRQRFDYSFEFGDDALIEDAYGMIHVRGSVRNVGPYPIEPKADGLLIGARLLNVEATPDHREPRSAFVHPRLGPGEASAFRLSLPRVDQCAENADWQIGLVCDGRFWFDAVGFPAARLTIDQQPMVCGCPAVAEATIGVSARPVWEEQKENGEHERLLPMPDLSPLETYRRKRSGTDPQATPDDLWNCYRLLLGREPDPLGFSAYAAIIERGMPCDELVRMFVASPEFAVRLRAPADPTITRAKLDGFELFVPQADAVVGEQILSGGIYEPHVTRAFLDALRENQTIVDVGANIGYFSVLAARKIGASGSVIAIEALARNVRLLLANTKINDLDNVTIVPHGASDREGFVTLMSMGSIASSREAILDDLTTVNAFDLAYATTIDTLLPTKPVHVIKVDIDGFDYRAMLGAKACLTRSHPEIFAEFAPALLSQFSGIKPADYLKFFLDCGYDDFSVLMHDGTRVSVNCDIDRIARLPAEIKATHVDIHIRKN